MSKHTIAMTVPVPVANVIPAAVYAAPIAGLQLQSQTPMSMRCKSAMSLMAYPVTVEITVSGVDGAANIYVYAHNFGAGPLQTNACRDKATALVGAMSNILQSWAQQQAAQAPAQPAGPNS